MPDSLKNVLIFLCVVAAGGCILAAYLIRGNLPLDRLLEYRITVSPGKDGSLEITYSYQWEVLNDSKEGPLTWVSLGVPNSSCTLLGYDGAIAGLHSAYNGGGLMEFDLDREYGKGEVAVFSFTIHQERMLCSNKRMHPFPIMTLRRAGLTIWRWSIIFLPGKEALLSQKQMRTDKKGRIMSGKAAWKRENGCG